MYFKLLIAGSIASLFFSPLYFFPCFFIGMRYFSHQVLYGKSDKIFIKACVFGFGYFLTLYHWLSFPLFIGGIEKYFALLPATIILVPILFSLSFSIPAYISYKSNSKNPFISQAIFILSWSAIELIRLQIVPFYPISFTLLPNYTLSQAFYYIDSYYLSIIILFISTLPKHFFKTFFFILVSSYTFLHLNTPFNQFEKNLNINISVIQTNIRQKNKNSYEGAMLENYKIYELMLKAKSDLLIMPEACFSMHTDTYLFQTYAQIFEEQQDLPNNIVQIGDENRIIYNNRLLIGINPSNLPNNKQIISGLNTLDTNWNFYTSCSIINKNNDQIKNMYIYDKNTLIPFGEYVPIRFIFSKIGFLKALAAAHGDYTTGKTPQIVSWEIQNQKLNIGLLICYESLFKIKNPENKKLDMIINVSNDAWFGNSFCLNQHLDHMKVQAISNRCLAIRSVNRGITCIIDEFGRIKAMLKPYTSGILEAKV